MEPKKSFIKRLLGVKTAEAPTMEQTQAPGLDINKIREAIAYAETRGVRGDKSAFSQASGNQRLGDAIGTYQVTEGELNTYGPQYTGSPIDIAQFRNNPTAQEEYINAKIRALAARGNTPQQIADIHRRGVKNSSPAGSTVYQDPGYVDIFNQYYNK